MILVADDWGKLPREAIEQARRVPLTDLSLASMPAASALEVAAIAAASRDLDYLGRTGGAGLRIRDGETGYTVPRRTLYALCPVDAVVDGAAILAAEIGNRHGPGRWWSTGAAVMYVGQGEGAARIAVVDGEPHVLLAAYYFWAPHTRAAAPALHGHPLRRAGDDLYVDTAGGPIKVTADPALGQGDLRINAAEQTFAREIHGRWADPPLVEEHHSPERMVPARRADGFDQGQVDAARTAMLAPAAPRYADPRAKGR